ncbi:hypothetical protein ABZP36_011503 [Zizania latifolia]
MSEERPVPRRESPWGLPEGDKREPKAHRCNDRAEDVVQACFEGNPFKTVPGPFKLFWQCMHSKPGERLGVTFAGVAVAAQVVLGAFLLVHAWQLRRLDRCDAFYRETAIHRQDVVVDVSAVLQDAATLRTALLQRLHQPIVALPLPPPG